MAKRILMVGKFDKVNGVKVTCVPCPSCDPRTQIRCDDCNGDLQLIRRNKI